MRITKLETFHLEPRWLFLRISTDEGLEGWGEPVVEGRARTVETAIRELEPVLVGHDPREIERLWQSMYRGTFYRGGPVLVSAISGIEQALWDIKGKYHNVPVYELLGGAVRDRVRMYAGIGKGTPEEVAERAKARIADGFTAMKTGVNAPIRPIETRAVIAEHAERFAAIREAVGDEVDIAVDFHGRVSPATAERLIEAIEPFHPLFVEEPCLPDNPAAMIEIAQSTSVPIATGERLFTRWGFRELMESRAISVFQPDLCHCGGIFEARKIAAMAEVNYAHVAPHNPLGPLSLASCIQLDCCTPNFLVQEHSAHESGRGRGVGYLKNPFEIVDGYIERPTAPGLGVEVDLDAIREKASSGDWDTPRLAYEDGSFAEW
jgi:galactonate dehydratase